MEGQFIEVETPNGSVIDAWVKEGLSDREKRWVCIISLQRMLIGETKMYEPQNN